MEALDIPPGLENLGNTCYMVRRRKKKIGVAKYSSLRNSL
jgi:ubiquitin C-terminal hydrolase